MFWGEFLLALILIALITDCTYKEERKEERFAKAVSAGDIDMVRLLIKKGANINVKDRKGVTALMEATGKGYIDIARLLIEKGADVNAKSDEGLTSLMDVSFKGNVEMVKLLIERGADVNAKENGGRTALIHTSAKGNIEIVKLLIEKGANTDGAYLYAIAAGNNEIADLIRESSERVQRSFVINRELPLYKLGNEKGLYLSEKYRDSIRNRVKENCIKEMEIEHINYDRNYIAGCIDGYEHSASVKDIENNYQIVEDKQSKEDKKLDYRKKTLTEDDLKKYR